MEVDPVPLKVACLNKQFHPLAMGTINRVFRAKISLVVSDIATLLARA